MRTNLSLRLVALAALAALLLSAGPGRADDRDLLWSKGARPNVLLVTDSSGSMAQDVATDCKNYIASGDDPHSKMFQVKSALVGFINAYPQFNIGFSFYERDNTQFSHHLFLYQMSTSGGSYDFSWRHRIAVGQTPGNSTNSGSQHHETIVAGQLIRLGAWTTLSGSTYLSSWPGPLFGDDGTYMFSDWSSTSTGSVYYNGNRQTGYYRVDTVLLEPRAGTGYYYPAYAWNATVQQALVTFDAIHITNAPTVFDVNAAPTDKIAAWNTLVAARQALQTTLDANQVGLRQLTIQTTLYQCQKKGNTNPSVNSNTGTCNNGWVQVNQMSRAINSAGGLTPSQVVSVDNQGGVIGSSDTTGGTYPAAFMVNEYSGCNYSGGRSDFDYTNDCNGWWGAMQNNTKIPLIPIPTDTDPDLLPYMKSYMRPMSTLQFYFPTRTGTGQIKYWPQYWDDRPQCDHTVAADQNCGLWVTDRVLWDSGNTPIKNSLDDSQQYFKQTIQVRPDPLRACRKDFVILLTDGLETCSSTTATCQSATNLGKQGVSVFVIGYGLGTAGNALQCIATNSGGQLYLPNTVDELIDALQKVGQAIEERIRGFASPSVPSVELSTREKGYISTFLPLTGRSIWEGHLRAYAVDPTLGTIPTACQTDATTGVTLCYPDTTKALWDAGAVLAQTSASARNIYYGTNASPAPGVRDAFTVTSSNQVVLWNRVFSDTQTSLTSTQVTRLTTDVNFIRGVRDSTIYRFPHDPAAPAIGVGKLGDVFHSMPLLNGRPDCFTCYLQDAHSYRADFYSPNLNRRKVLFVGADDGMLHAFDGGFFDRDHANFPDLYDDGTGKELFGYVPNSVMPVLDRIAEGTDQYYTVDGTSTASDVYIKRLSTDSSRSWRTVLAVGQRNGGNSYVLLDVTQPDPYVSDLPQPADTTNWMPGCLTGTTSGCTGPYPALRWEFRDPGDSDANGYPDLNQSWSRPAFATVAVKADNAASTAAAEYRDVVIFGGGYEQSLHGGNFLYFVDAETGVAALKLKVAGSVPGEIALLDENFDGVIERAYFGDAAGNLWRLDTTATAVYDHTTRQITCTYAGTTANCGGWTLTKLLDTSADGAQPFFQKPVIVLAGYSSTSQPLYAIGAGAGNREDIFQHNDPAHRFYFVLDDGSGTTLTSTNLQTVNLTDTATTQNFLLGGSTMGWDLVLGTWEKVNTPAVALQGQVIFSTFTPGSGTIVVPDPNNPGHYLCRQNGDAKTYVVDYLNANPRYVDSTGALSRVEQLPGGIQMLSELLAYVGEDGKMHVLQGADDTSLNEPINPVALGGSVLSWRERTQ